MLILAGTCFFLAVLFWFADDCIPDASVNLSQVSRALIMASALLVCLDFVMRQSQLS